MTEPKLPADLPSEILEEIFYKLPVKSLIRFRCVSKSWNSLISETTFARRHLSRNKLSKRTFILDNPMEPVGKQLYGYSLPSLQSRQIKVVGRRAFTRFDVGFFWKLVASCDGLLCAHYDGSIYIWNPCDWKSLRTVPINQPGKPTFCDSSKCCFGFGYDSTRDDYKLCLLSIPKRCSPTNTFVYSLKSDSWEKLNDFPPHYLPTKSVFVNGLVYWLVFCGKLRTNPYAIFSLDLSDNKYKEVPLPECMPNDLLVDLKLCPCEEMLCVLVNSTSSGFVLWSMQKDCHNLEENSWTKHLDIRIELVFDKYCVPVDIEPIYMYENGDVLLAEVSKKGTVLMLCRDNMVLFRKNFFQQPALIQCGLVYVESLLCPNRLDDVAAGTSCKYKTLKEGDKGHNCSIRCNLRRFSDSAFGCFGGMFSPPR